jgi:DNA-binding NtrC family response regulator
MQSPDLKNRRILVVEDRYMLAEDLRRSLEKAGAVVVGPAPTVERALSLMAAEPELGAAVLDVNLGGEPVFPVADALIERHIPFVFATGYGDEVLQGRYAEVPRCDKPVEIRTMARVLAEAIGG